MSGLFVSFSLKQEWRYFQESKYFLQVVWNRGTARVECYMKETGYLQFFRAPDYESRVSLAQVYGLKGDNKII